MKLLYYPLIFVALLNSQAFAQQAQQLPQPSLGEVFMQMMPMFAVVFFIFYFMVIRPQQKKMLDQEQLVKGLKKGDEVITSSGMYGKVVLHDEKSVTLEVSPNVKIKFLASAIQKKEEVK